MPALSVITVNLNNAWGLAKTIQSVKEQTFKDVEMIVVDGGSTDGSVDILKKNGTVISKWISESDAGIFNAMNKGIEMARGEYCLFLNSGDYLYNEGILEQMFRRKNDVDIFYGDMYVEKAVDKLEYHKSSSSITVLKMLKDTLWHPVSFIRRNLFAEHGKYDERFKIVADYEFFTRVIIEKKVRTQYIPLPVSVFNLSGASSNLALRGQLEKERMRVQDIYFNPLLLCAFRFYSRLWK